MGNETKSNGASNIGGGFRAKMEHYVYSGEKKHVLAGIGIISIIFGIPWYLMNQGSKHRSHQDYLEKADKARKARLSSSSSSDKSLLLILFSSSSLEKFLQTLASKDAVND